MGAGAREGAVISSFAAKVCACWAFVRTRRGPTTACASGMGTAIRRAIACSDSWPRPGRRTRPTTTSSEEQ
jgi:hypothetical protein